MKHYHIIICALLASASLPAMAQEERSQAVEKFLNQTIEQGTDKKIKREESTAAVSVITSETTDKRSAKNIGNSILGQGSGLISLQNGGRYAAQNPTFYVRGLQSLNGNNRPLVLVDGIERDITTVSPEEVESVSILKDAAGVALYGYKGVNGVVEVTTKRGQYNSRSVQFTYDHLFNSLIDKPKFVDAATYASAMNEARANDGLSARYSAQEIEAFRSGKYPYLYPNVNWVNETFRDNAMTNKYNLQFQGGSQRFRYYTMVDLLSDKGFIKTPNANEGYSTQDKYVKGNLRMNLDIDLTPTTDVHVNLLGVLSESSRPGAAVDLWDMVYTLPSAAFPVRSESGRWSGSNDWAGTINPVAQSQGAAYYKQHYRSLFTDITIEQDLSAWLKGLSASVRAGFDNAANIYEDHSKTYVYSVVTPSWPDGAAEPTFTESSYGEDSQMGAGSAVNSYDRRFHFDGGFRYNNTFGNHSIYSQLKWDYEMEDPDGLNNTIYRQNVTFFNHYGFKNRYFADLTLVESGSSRLAPGTKWNFSPTLGLAWVLSKEKFMENVKWVDFLKLRGSAGLINADYLPGDNLWTYYARQYSLSGVLYPYSDGWNSDFGSTDFGRIATPSPSHERAYKYNIGVDASLFGSLNLTVDAYKQRRNNIWVSGAGIYTDVIGQDAPYVNKGVVDSWGTEISADYSRTFGEVKVNLGGNFAYNRNKIVEQGEAPQLYDNLVSTGKSLGQIFGLKATGFFRDQADIDKSLPQTFTTVRPGDVKYEDVNGDKVIDSNDRTAIGYNTIAPEIYYNFSLGAEWKGLGFYAMFQGTGRYSAVLNTKSMFWPLINKTNISQYAYDNRWTPDNQNARFPRLSSQSNANNYQTSTLWLADRSFLKLRNLEVYYNLPASVLQPLRFVKGARLYVRGVDLLCFDHIDENDPEAYGIAPLNRSVALGVSLTF